MMFVLSTLASVLAVSSTATAAMLYNGGQKFMLSPGISSSCDAAFNTTINCPDNIIQLVTYSMTNVAWNTSAMTSLCTSQCTSSLQTLANAVSSGCGTEYFPLNGRNKTYTDLVDFVRYKYGFICLKDTTTSNFCLDVEKSWNITTMVAAKKATWPTNPPRCYMDFSSGHYGYIVGTNGTCINPFDPDDFSGYTNWNSSRSPTAMDYYQVRGPPVNDSNYGWASSLGYDEYPLEIQCSSCMTQNFKYGFTSKWGSPWDEMSDQTWTNMKRNCRLNDTIVPAVNLTGRGLNSTFYNPPPPFVPSSCPRNITIGANVTTCGALSVQYQFALQSLTGLIDPLADCNNLVNMSICVPAACPIALVNTKMSVLPFVKQYTNMTLPQLLRWNPSMNTRELQVNETVCVGPAGGAFTPSVVAPAPTSTVYTTTCTPSHPTPTGTIPNCGHYYTVVTGDYCGNVTLKFNIAFSDFVNMNPSLDSQCTNLTPGLDYCVAPVNGTKVTPVTSTKQPPSTTTTTTTKTTTTSWNGVTTPTPTQSGMAANCKTFYDAVSGDGCYQIAQKYGISLDQFYAWNPAVKSDCSALWPNYYYCVGM